MIPGNLTKVFFILTLSFYLNVSGQTIDSVSFSIYPRQTFYSNEVKAELLLEVPVNLVYSNLNVIISNRDSIILEWKGVPGKQVLRIPAMITDLGESGDLKAEISVPWQSGKIYKCSCKVPVLEYKVNEVKVDRFTGGLIVNNRKFFPFGFYCYSPVRSELTEDEAINGFNMISPYQRVLPETLGERKAYMDRCAQLGIKVHYNLLSVSGGGGVNSEIEGISDEKKKEFLINEIETFRDHPALLAWYIADEPTGDRVSPDSLEVIYKLVKETDPWHPVTIVFMVPFKNAKKYINAMDIAMADPYPVPDMPVSMVGNAAVSMKRDFSTRKPLWMVPQVFGGGELWGREPTANEVRSMTWQSVVRGATGIQYFIRQGPNAFPKSIATWNECSRIAHEIASLTPWLLSDEETIPVSSGSENILVSSKLYRGQLIIMAVNKVNAPQRVDIRINSAFSGRAFLPFENRSVQVYSGSLSDYIQPFGSLVYRINIRKEPESFRAYKSNLIRDPGFEEVVSPGVPSACYARPGADRGATYFLDPMDMIEGGNSLRIRTPVENKGVALRFFPISVKPGRSYMVSIWAKSDPDQRFIIAPGSGMKDVSGNDRPQYAEISVGNFSRSRFAPGKEWKEFVTFVTIPDDSVSQIKVNVSLRMPGQGVAWFDMLQVIEDPLKR